jgi:hypothetical protein
MLSQLLAHFLIFSQLIGHFVSFKHILLLSWNRSCLVSILNIYYFCIRMFQMSETFYGCLQYNHIFYEKDWSKRIKVNINDQVITINKLKASYVKSKIASKRVFLHWKNCRPEIIFSLPWMNPHKTFVTIFFQFWYCISAICISPSKNLFYTN